MLPHLRNITVLLRLCGCLDAALMAMPTAELHFQEITTSLARTATRYALVRVHLHALVRLMQTDEPPNEPRARILLAGAGWRNWEKELPAARAAPFRIKRVTRIYCVVDAASVEDRFDRPRPVPAPWNQREQRVWRGTLGNHIDGALSLA